MMTSDTTLLIYVNRKTVTPNSAIARYQNYGGEEMKLGQTSFINFLTQIIMSLAGFAANIVIARVLGPSVQGTYFLVVSLIFWIALAGNMGLRQSLKKRLSEEGADSSIITTGLIVQGFMSILVAVAILVFSARINAYVGAPVAKWLVLMVLVKLAFDFVGTLLDGQHKVHLSSLLAPADWTVRSTIQILLASMGVGLVGLFSGYIFGGIVAVFVGLYFMRTHAEIHIVKPTWSGLRSLYSFAKYSWLGSISSRSFSSMDTVILGVFVVNSLIGVYEIAWNLASILAIFGFSISRAVFPELSSVANSNPERVKNVLSTSIGYAGLFLIPGLIGAVIVGDVVLTIYGHAYTKGHQVLVVLIVARLFYAYLTQFLVTISALDHPEINFRINGIFLIANLVLNVVLIDLYGWIGAAFATAASTLIALGLGYRSLSRLIEIRIPTEELGRQIVSALLMGVIVYSGRELIGDSLTVILLLVLVGAAIYFGIFATISPQFRQTVRNNLPT